MGEEHKKRFSCTGKRNRSEFVKRGEFSDVTLMSGRLYCCLLLGFAFMLLWKCSKQHMCICCIRMIACLNRRGKSSCPAVVQRMSFCMCIFMYAYAVAFRL